MKNIFLIGQIKGQYRSQNLIKYLLDKGYSIYYSDYEINLFEGNYNFIFRSIRVIVRNLNNLFLFLHSIYFLLVSDCVLILAMCNDRHWEIRLAKFFRKPIICDFYLSFYDTLVLDKQLISKDSRAGRKNYTLDRNCLELSDYVFFLNRTEANYYLNLFDIGFCDKRHKILPLCVEGFEKTKQDSNNETLNREFIICWWGSYIPLHGLYNLIYSFKILLDEGYLFKVYLFGDKDEKSKPYQDYIIKLGLKNHVIIDNSKSFKNGKLEPFLLKNCKLALGNFGDSEKAKSVIVNKLIDSVALKIPVLTGESSAPKEFFQENEVFYSLNSPDSIADAIVKVMLTSDDEIKKRVERGYNTYQENFSVGSFYKKLDIFFSKSF